MKKIFFLSLLLALFAGVSSCKKDSANNDLGGSTCDLPHNGAPAQLQGEWVSGYTSFTQVVDAYDGHNLGSTWQSGKYFNFTNDGKKTFFYYMAASQYASVATKAAGTIEFDEGATSESGSFTFYACQGHYKSWGTPSVDRDATDQELNNNLTRRYYYQMDGDWLRIEPGAPPTAYSSSFRKLN